jgi:hypothetical protein
MAVSFLSSFISPAPRKDKWHFVGLASAYPDILHSGSTRLANHLPCKKSVAPGCKVFRVPLEGSTLEASEVPLVDIDESHAGELQDQVLVFRYKGKFHAVNNVGSVHRLIA